MLGATIEWDVEVRGVEDGCFSKFYSVALPQSLESGAYGTQEGYHYCDASYESNFGGVLCPELNFMEANNVEFSTTPNACVKRYEDGNYLSCFSNERNTLQAFGFGGYGFGRNNSIDTSKPFHVKIHLEQTDG